MSVRYEVRRMQAQDGRDAGWGVYRRRGVRLAVGYSGLLAWWRARFRAAALNRKAWR